MMIHECDATLFIIKSRAHRQCKTKPDPVSHVTKEIIENSHQLLYDVNNWCNNVYREAMPIAMTQVSSDGADPQQIKQHLFEDILELNLLATRGGPSCHGSPWTLMLIILRIQATTIGAIALILSSCVLSYLYDHQN